ncbi:transposase [Trichocoleus desertorum]|uniref:transposase n=1 Tax=Trichocoleus desertorum TaxID=1481672 RepID=UPI003D654710
MANQTNLTGNQRFQLWLHKNPGTPIYLPPYSPDFSPIENCWSKLKSLLRSAGARSYSALDKAIQEAFAQISLEDIRNWFTHCCYCTSVD